MKIVRKSSTPATSQNNLADNTATYAATHTASLGKRSTNYNNTGTINLKQADFTHMTHRQLRDWMNGEIHAGHMSMEQSTPFLWLNMNYNMEDEFEKTVYEDNSFINFIAKAREGKDNAKAADNTFVVDMFQVAIDIMEEHQGQTIGVDTCV